MATAVNDSNTTMPKHQAGADELVETLPGLFDTHPVKIQMGLDGEAPGTKIVNQQPALRVRGPLNVLSAQGEVHTSLAYHKFGQQSKSFVLTSLGVLDLNRPAGWKGNSTPSQWSNVLHGVSEKVVISEDSSNRFGLLKRLFRMGCRIGILVPHQIL